MKNIIQKILVILLIFVMTTTGIPALAEDVPSAGPGLTDQQLDELVGKIALYPDPLLAQMLPATTYPLEVVQAARLIQSEKDFDKIDKQDWDPSVKAIAYYPTVTKMMNDDLAWTQKLGTAVITQQEDVMVSVQRMRKLAQNAGNLQTTKEQIVTVSPSTIEIVPASPEIIYVPVYNPVVVYVVPVVRPRFSLISFLAFRIGGWLEVGLYWPSYSIYYCGPTWWYGGWHRHYHHHIHHMHVTNVTHVTSIAHIYNVKSVKNVWKHNPKRIVTHQHSHKNVAAKINTHDENNHRDSQKPQSDNNSFKKSKTTKNEVIKRQNNNLENFKKQMKQSEKRMPKAVQADNLKETKKQAVQNNDKNSNQTKPHHEIKTGKKETADSISKNSSHHKSPEVKNDRSTTHEHKNRFSQKQTQKSVSRGSGKNSSSRHPDTIKEKDKN